MFPQLTAMQALLPAIIALVFAIVSLAAPAPRVEDQDLRYLLEYDAVSRAKRILTMQVNIKLVAFPK